MVILRRTMHGRAKLATAKTYICLDFVQIFHAIKVTLLASHHQCCVAIFIHGIHIASAQIMQGLLYTINVLLQRNIHTTNYASLNLHHHTHCNTNANPFIPHYRIHHIHLRLFVIFRATLPTTQKRRSTLQSHSTHLYMTTQTFIHISLS